MIRNALCAAVIGLLLFTASAQAEIKQHPIGLQIWIPDTWATEADGDLLMTTSPDDGAIVILMVLSAWDVNQALDEMDRELSRIIQNIRTTVPADQITINGLNGVTEEGVGTVDGVPIDWLAGLFPYRSHALMVLGFAESSRFAAYEQMLVEIFSSLQPY